MLETGQLCSRMQLEDTRLSHARQINFGGGVTKNQDLNCVMKLGEM